MLFWVVLLCIPVIIFELSIRVWLSVKIGPDLLLYGTRFSYYKKTFVPQYREVKDVEKWKKIHQVTFVENDKKNYSKYYPYQIRNDNDENGNVFRVSINSEGFRGDNFLPNKKDGIVRIITLGASSTFGFHNRDNETYPYYIEKMLNQKCNNDILFEVINFGIPHMKSNNILSLLLSEAVELDPDIITYCQGINDAFQPINDPASKDVKRSNEEGNNNIKSLLDHLLYTLTDRFIIFALTSFVIEESNSYLFKKRSKQEFTPQGKVDYYLNNLALINEEGEHRPILFIVASQQAKSNLIDREQIKGLTYDEEVILVKDKFTNENITSNELYFLNHHMLMEGLKNWVMKNDVLFVDGIKVLDYDRETLSSWVHLNPKGNRILAKAFTEKILSKFCY